MMLDILGFGKTIAQFPNKEINTYIPKTKCDFLNENNIIYVFILIKILLHISRLRK